MKCSRKATLIKGRSSVSMPVRIYIVQIFAIRSIVLGKP